ncbi:hypothetical protein C6P44_003785 [Monosporozyma unispora]|nr:hypothetical protein C6P44_003785 [Kazachstania unispora]
MRAPPPHRKSRSIKIPLFFINLKKKLKCNDWKRRKRIHLLHRLHRKKYNSRVDTPPDSGLRIEDSFTLRTEYLHPDVIDKPLVIATFSGHCQELPTINILERSKLSRLHLMKRIFKLKLFTYNMTKLSKSKHKNGDPENNNDNNFGCVSTVRSIKNLVEKEADVRIIFHNKNTIRSFPVTSINNEKGEYISFTKDASLRIDSFPSLTRHQSGLVNIDEFSEEIFSSSNVELPPNPPRNIESNEKISS